MPPVKFFGKILPESCGDFTKKHRLNLKGDAERNYLRTPIFIFINRVIALSSGRRCRNAKAMSAEAAVSIRYAGTS